MGFDHVLSLYTWNAQLHYDKVTSLPMLNRITLHGDAQSRLREDTRTRTSEARGYLTSDLALLNAIDLGAFFTIYGSTYNTSSAPLSALGNLGTITNLLDGYVLGGVKQRLYSDASYAQIGVGVTRQTQSVASFYGTIYQALLAAPTLTLGEGHTLDASASVDERLYSSFDQHFRYDQAGARLTSDILGHGTNSAYVGVDLHRRDFLFSQDSTAKVVRQERQEFSVLIQDSLSYPFISDQVQSTLRVELEPKSVTRRTPGAFENNFISPLSPAASLYAPTSISSLRLGGSARFFYEFGEGIISELPVGAQGISAEIRYDEKNETVSLINTEAQSLSSTTFTKIADILDQESFASNLTQFSLESGLDLSRKDRLAVAFNARIYRYDTPNAQNHDDRDDLLSAISIGYLRGFSENLLGEISLKLSRSHLVYLASDRSAQNNITRTIALSSTATYTSSLLSQKIRSEVFANYTVLDYYNLLPLLQDGSYLLRGLSIYDSTALFLGKAFGETNFFLQGQLDVRISERGSFNEEKFTEKRNTTISEGAGELVLGAALPPTVLPIGFRAGVRGFRAQRYGFLTTGSLSEWNIAEDNLRIGPILYVDLTREHFSVTASPKLSGWLWIASVTARNGAPLTTTVSRQIESGLSINWPL